MENISDTVLGLTGLLALAVLLLPVAGRVNFPYTLFLAVARIPSGKAHTVLVAATSDGDFVLDNLKSAVLPWRRLPYAWKIRQSAASPARWYNIPRG